MSKSLKWLALAALVPGMALASITNSKHDFSSASTAAVKSTTENQTCKFCHVPHGAISGQTLLWSHQPTAATAYAWGGATATTSGTTLPTTAGITTSAARCFACHDGTIAVGALNINGTAQTITVSGTDVNASGVLTNAFYVVSPGAMNTHHPVSIPYPGTTAAYNGTLSGVNTPAELALYGTITSTGCTSQSGVCTSATGGTAINLVRGAAGSTGIECVSCHVVHGETGSFTRFLRVDIASSALCLACHIK